jgi:DNA polymerase bacteriophage-type
MEPWQQILADNNYPTDILVVDFETVFDDEYSLKKLSTIEYINSPKFELTGLGIGDSRGFTHFYCPSLVEEKLREIDWNKTVCVMQNARFDATILQTKFNIVPKYIIDVKDLACHYDAQMSHHLKDLALLFGLQPKGKTENFKGLHYNDMTSEQRKALAEYCVYGDDETGGDVKIETQLFKILLPFLSNPSMELRLQRHTLDLWLHRGFDFDRDLADSLKTQMSCNITLAAAKVGMTPEELRSQKFLKRLREVLPAGELIPMKVGKRGNIPALAKNDDGCQFLLNHPKQEVRDLIEARQAVKSWPLHHKRVDNMLHQADANEGVLRVPLNYYGGHTGRWSGGEDINLQNLGGRGRAGKGVDPLIGQMRELLKALPGHTLGIGDSAQIEARVLAWLAGQQDLVDGFARGEDIYSEFATTLFQKPVRKERKTDPKPVGRMMTIKRGFGKDAILGCGYGMGASKFYDRCRENPSLSPLFDSGEYTVQFIERLIKTYRTKYACIPAYWKKVENAFRQVLKYPHLKPTVGPLEFSAVGHEVRIKLPSDRILYYRHCSVGKTERGFAGTLKYHHGHLWGGSITENVVQAVSRDLLGFWILECEAVGLDVVLTVHDEIVCMIKKETEKGLEVKDQLNWLNNILCSLPTWAAGLPVSAETKESNVYCK